MLENLKPRPMSDAELAEHVIPDSLQKLHMYTYDKEAVLALAKEAVAHLATCTDDDHFITHVPKTLMLLAVLDHMNDQRTCGMIPDYFNF